MMRDMAMAVVTTTRDMDTEDTMGMEAEADTAVTRDEEAEAVVDSEAVVEVDEAAVEAVVTLQTKVGPATGLRTQMLTPVVVVVRKKGTPRAVVQMHPMPPTIPLHLFKHHTVVAVEVMAAEAVLDEDGVAEGAAEEEPTLST
jgi:hypothetical protein